MGDGILTTTNICVRLATRLDNLLGTAVLVMHWEPILIYGGAIPLPRSNTTSNRSQEPDGMSHELCLGRISVGGLHHVRNRVAR